MGNRHPKEIRILETEIQDMKKQTSKCQANKINDKESRNENKLLQDQIQKCQFFHANLENQRKF